MRARAITTSPALCRTAPIHVSSGRTDLTETGISRRAGRLAACSAPSSAPSHARCFKHAPATAPFPTTATSAQPGEPRTSPSPQGPNTSVSGPRGSENSNSAAAQRRPRPPLPRMPRRRLTRNRSIGPQSRTARLSGPARPLGSAPWTSNANRRSGRDRPDRRFVECRAQLRVKVYVSVLPATSYTTRVLVPLTAPKVPGLT